ncbi:uncharacterized protein si:dkeyp-110g5.4 isoform X2 [Scomber japonicus]|uniref:uncharacterized protein si:dkeyp-110g5.4 isoform X2 n=1 Tax=Scomber japonicus TaxID=13676 RepID=UPI0023062BBD|nr:uncharacterized protein si:dkeyp-110g5.4 isoform X2 [Scomber japonicus]
MNIHTMDLLQLELYIPEEAEVKNIPIQSLPNSVLRRMGLPPLTSEDSNAPADSQEVIWICPTVIRKKDQTPATQTGNSETENMSLKVSREFRDAQGPLQMSVVSSNCTAYKLLQNMMPGKKVSKRASNTPLLSQGPPIKIQQDVIVIYHKRIYLIVKNPKRQRCEPQSEARSSRYSASAVSCDSQEKASLEPEDKELQRKRMRVTSPKASPKHDLLTKPEKPSTNKRLHTDQELLNDNKSNNRRARRRQTIGLPTPVDQEEEANNVIDECETQALHSPQADASSSLNYRMDKKKQREYQNDNYRVPQSASVDWSSQHQSCDFTELAQREKIAKLKAKLRQSDPHNKQSTK